MAIVYGTTGQPGRALELYEQALPLMRAVGDQVSEAYTLNNMGEVYRITGKAGKALEMYQQALLILRELGDRAGEATILNNIAIIYSRCINHIQDGCGLI
jgi:tetratricopeptide (TPR) repeat protein